MRPNAGRYGDVTITRVRLFLWSFLLLFVELALIRWAGETIVYLSYFTNFVLLGSFLGIGVGFLRAGSRRPIFHLSPVAVALLVGLTAVFPAKIDRTGDGIIYFGEFTRSGLPAWLVLPIVFVAVAAIMAILSDGVARLFSEFEPLTAYRLDILGAVGGTLGFALLAWMQTPPIVWGSVAAGLMLLLITDRTMLVVAGSLALVVMLGAVSLSGDIWSPYYRISVAGGDGSHGVTVNGIPHQTIVDIETRVELEPIYEVPYQRYLGEADSVLVIGAGNGTDVAIALANGASHVDAVEIDPALYELGLDLHPDRPYLDNRVDVIIDDGRSYIERTDRRYDLILYALPDSLTLVGGQGNLRLESFLFTIEALESVRELLTDDGAFAMYNFYREAWLVERLAGMLDTTIGSPCVDLIGTSGGLATMIAAPDASMIDCAGGAAIDVNQAARPTTDDKPFLYLNPGHVPTIYLVAAALVLVLAVAGVRAFGGPLSGVPLYIDLFFMGAAFLLLETKTVVQFSLLFGTTWFVNVLVFAGILTSVLAAIEVARWRRLPPPPVLYSALFGLLAVAWAIPPAWLLSFAGPVRFLVGISIAFAPVFIANLIFAQRFKDTASSTTAFGVNLLGAMLGGVLEYASIWLGYRWLTILAAVLYATALVSWRAIERSGTTVRAGRTIQDA